MTRRHLPSIRAAEPLTASPFRGADPLARCNVCGEAAAELRLWRECDEHDQPRPGLEALVFLGRDHPDCHRRLQAHPRLYIEERGEPGHFPRLCGPCAHRQGPACRHPDLRTNGGAGLKVDLSSGFPRGTICVLTRGGGGLPTQHAVACAGHQLA